MSNPPSANGTVVTVNGGAITDVSRNAWTLYNGQVEVNGVVDSTANVIELAYVNGLVWQRNASNLWWAKSNPSDHWLPAYGTPVSPLFVSTNPVSADDTVATVPGQTITDANHNVWSVSAGGQVVTDGVVDPTTANVIELAYENGQVWQENSSGLWWAKSVPSDHWLPTYGTSASPVPTRLWIGGGDNTAGNPANWSPAGVPQPGDTLQIGNGTAINVMGNDLAGDTLNAINVGSTITINAKDSAQLDLSIPFSTVNLNVADTAMLNASAVHGVLNASGGTIQFIGTTELGASRAILNDNLTGNATVALSGAQGEGTFAEVNGSVGPYLTFSLQSVAELQIDHPDRFAAALNIGSGGVPLENVLFAGLTAPST